MNLTLLLSLVLLCASFTYVSAHEQLIRACKSNDYEQVERVMFQTKADPSANQSEALVVATKQFPRNVPLLKLLLSDSKVDPTVNNSEALLILVQYADNALFSRVLLDPRVDPSVRNNIILSAAICENRLDNVEVLMAHPKFDPSIRYPNTFKLACIKGHLEMIKYLLANVKITPDIYNAVEIAYRGNHVETVKFFIETFGIDEIPSSDVLVWACEKGHTEIVELLLSFPGVDLSVKDETLNKIHAMRRNNVLDRREIMSLYSAIRPSANAPRSQFNREDRTNMAHLIDSLAVFSEGLHEKFTKPIKDAIAAVLELAGEEPPVFVTRTQNSRPFQSYKR